MWRRYAVLLAVVFCQLPALGFAQSDGGFSLISDPSWIRFDVVLGRIRAASQRVGKAERTLESPSVRESMAVSSDRCGRICYEREEQDRTISLEILNSSQINLRVSSSSETGKIVEFVQPERGALQLIIHGRDERVIGAATLWHLLLADRRACELHLLPLLDLLRPDWRLLDSADAIEAALFQSASAGSVPSLTVVQRLIGQLDSPMFVEREGAARSLVAMGISVLPQLRSVDASLLTNEQRHRLQQVVCQLDVGVSDTPERVAAWLLTDEPVWITLLSHPVSHRRELAVKHLAEIQPRAFHFDPHASEHSRARQIVLLRSQLTD